MEGWIKLHRKLQNWEWYKTPNMVHLFIHLLLVANHQKGKWQNIDIQRGQLVSGRNKLSASLGISPQSVRTCLGNLQLTNEIAIKSTNKYSIITINKYEDYQLYEKDINQQTNQQNPIHLTNGQPANQPQTRIYKNNKEYLLRKEEILKEEIRLKKKKEKEEDEIIKKNIEETNKWLAECDEINEKERKATEEMEKLRNYIPDDFLNTM